MGVPMQREKSDVYLTLYKNLFKMNKDFYVKPEILKKVTGKERKHFRAWA